jgi:hypothetical protein
MAMLAGGRLQLAFQQALQMLQALGLVEQQAQRPGLAQQVGGRARVCRPSERRRLQDRQSNRCGILPLSPPW